MAADEFDRFAVTLEALETSAHVPESELTEGAPGLSTDSSAWAWDEERRQARLAGGA